MHLLDANVLIEAKNTYYRFPVAPGFWQWVQVAHERGLVASVPAVRSELLTQEDELSAWVRGLPDSFWVAESDATVEALRTLAHWAIDTAPRLSAGARTDFLASADYRLIAEALAGNHEVITREQSSPQSVKRAMIPDVCAAHGVKVADPFEFYERLGLAMHLLP